jgi:hypothetical protein
VSADSARPIAPSLAAAHLKRVSVSRERRQKMKPRLPPGYYLERYPNLSLIVLRRRDGYFVAAFSLRGVEREVIEEVAWRDSRGEPTPEAVLWDSQAE